MRGHDRRRSARLVPPAVLAAALLAFADMDASSRLLMVAIMGLTATGASAKSGKAGEPDDAACRSLDGRRPDEKAGRDNSGRRSGHGHDGRHHRRRTLRPARHIGPGRRRRGNPHSAGDVPPCRVRRWAHRRAHEPVGRRRDVHRWRQHARRQGCDPHVLLGRASPHPTRVSLSPSWKTEIHVHGNRAHMYSECHFVDLATGALVAPAPAYAGRNVRRHRDKDAWAVTVPGRHGGHCTADAVGCSATRRRTTGGGDRNGRPRQAWAASASRRAGNRGFRVRRAVPWDSTALGWFPS